MVPGVKSKANSIIIEKVHQIEVINHYDVKQVIINSICTEIQCQVYLKKSCTEVNCDLFTNNILIRYMFRKKPEPEKQVMNTQRYIINI